MALAVTAMVSCGSADSISVSEDAMPKLEYVCGQELDFSEGVLLVKNGKKTVEIPLNSEGVTVSGYDKNTVGEQTVTIEYDGVTTEIKVTVSPNVVVSGAVTDYLVGDSFNAAKGVATVTKADGTKKVIFLSSEDVTLTGFDSSVANSGLTVKVACKLGGESYEGSYTVKIHAVDEVKFQRPNKISYSSHYSLGADVSGGYFTLMGNGGKTTTNVNITADMVSGFNPSAVTAANSPLTQIVTVTYNGVPYTYEVKLTYTNISMICDSAEAFKSISWNGDSLPTISGEQGELALSLMSAYVAMNTSERELIPLDDVIPIAKAAMVYGFNAWANDVTLFNGAFGVVEGQVVLYAKSYQDVVDALELFGDKSNAIYTVAPLLLDIITIFGDEVVYQRAGDPASTIYFRSYPVMTEQNISNVKTLLLHLVDIYEDLSVVPYGWSADDLEQYSEKILSAYTEMLTGGYASYFYRLYYHVSEWREDNAIFDIFYTYFYNKDNLDALGLLYSVGLPGSIDEIYQYAVGAVQSIDSIESQIYKDTTIFFYNYYRTLECMNNIKANGSDMEKYVLENAYLNTLMGASSATAIDFEVMLEYMRTMPYGYYDLSAGLLGIESYDAFMTKYIEVVKNLVDNDAYDDTDEYAAAIKDLLDAYASLTPTQQYGVLSILNSQYADGAPELAFDDSEANMEAGLVCQLVVMINNHVRGELPETYASIYGDLVLAMEIYANRFGYDEWESDFTARIDNVTASLGNMSTEVKGIFDYYLGVAYAKYFGIREALRDNTPTDLGDFADEFELLGKALTDVQTAYYYLANSTTAHYNYFFAAFERATDISEQILGAPEHIVYAYYNEAIYKMYIANTEGGTDEIYLTYDYALGLYRDLYIDALAFYGGSTNVYDIYNGYELSEFFSTYYDMASAYVNKEEGSAIFDREKTLAALEAFRLLDSKAKSFFMVMEGELDLYYTALEAFIAEQFTEAAAEVATKLYTLERYYYSYETVNDETTLRAIEATLGELKTLYANLEGADSASFEVLLTAYEYYVARCEALLSAN